MAIMVSHENHSAIMVSHDHGPRMSIWQMLTSSTCLVCALWIQTLSAHWQFIVSQDCLLRCFQMRYAEVGFDLAIVSYLDTRSTRVNDGQRVAILTSVNEFPSPTTILCACVWGGGIQLSRNKLLLPLYLSPESVGQAAQADHMCTVTWHGVTWQVSSRLGSYNFFVNIKLNVKPSLGT